SPIPAIHFMTYPGEYHTPFSISADGEALFLTRSDGSLADQTASIGLPRDISMGPTQGEESTWLYFNEPTPGAPNPESGYLGIVAAPEFSVQPGFHTESFLLGLLVTDPE